MSPDRIHVATVLPPRERFVPGATGAVGMVVRLLARASAAPWQVTVFGAPQPEPVFGDVDFRPVQPLWWRPADANRRYAEAVARALGRAPALIEVHNKPDIALHLAARFPHAPVLLFLHNDPQEMRRGRLAVERAGLLSRLAGVAAVSDHIRRRLLDGVDAPGGSVTVLPNPIDLAALPAPVAPDQRDKVILFAGRVVADKGSDRFVAACGEALPRLQGWRADIIGADRFRAGSADTPFLRDVRRAAERAGVGMLGHLAHPELMSRLARAAIAVVPSRWQEPFGLTALEALAAGAALICSPRGGLPEVAGDAAVYADPDRPGALAEAIVSLAQDGAARAVLGAAGRARAALFDLPAAGERLAALRRETLARWPGSGTTPI